MAGHGTLRGLATRFGVSASALRRHRSEHVPDVLKRAQSLDDIATAESLADQIRTLRARALQVLARAAADADSKTELSALRELRALAELEARGSERSATVINVAVVQDYIFRLVEIVREFVPPQRLAAALARIEAVYQPEQSDVRTTRPLLTERS